MFMLIKSPCGTLFSNRALLILQDALLSAQFLPAMMNVPFGFTDLVRTSCGATDFASSLSEPLNCSRTRRRSTAHGRWRHGTAGHRYVNRKLHRRQGYWKRKRHRARVAYKARNPQSSFIEQYLAMNKLVELRKRQHDAKLAEAEKQVEKEKLAEAKRIVESKRQAEAKLLAESKRQAEAKWLAEAKRRAEPRLFDPRRADAKTLAQHWGREKESGKNAMTPKKKIHCCYQTVLCTIFIGRPLLSQDMGKMSSREKKSSSGVAPTKSP